MHNEIRYTGDDAEAKALADVIDWLSERQWAAIRDHAQTNPDTTLDQLKMVMSFAGVQGFPVLAVHKHLWPHMPHTETDSE